MGKFRLLILQFAKIKLFFFGFMKPDRAAPDVSYLRSNVDPFCLKKGSVEFRAQIQMKSP